MHERYVSLESFEVMHHLQRRRSAEQRFAWTCRLAVLAVIVFLLVLMGSLILQGVSAFFRTEVRLNIHNRTASIAGTLGCEDAGCQIIAESMLGLQAESMLRHYFQQSSENSGKNRRHLKAPSHVWVLASEELDAIFKRCLLNPWLGPVEPRYQRPDPEAQAAQGCWPLHEWLEKISPHHHMTPELRLVLNRYLLSQNDSQEPESAGIFGALLGSLMCLALALACAVPLALGAALYLEIFAPRHRWFDILEVHINNLASVPSIVYGLLGLAFFLNLFKLPRGSSLVGGLTLGLIILPMLIMTYRLAIRSVPGSILQGAQALGASAMQVAFHHVLPCAVSGMLTGTILGIARVFGESAPLLMLGMVAFVPSTPHTFLDPATVLPVQLYNWARNPHPGFAHNAAAAVLIMLFILVVLNAVAMILRNLQHKRFS